VKSETVADGRRRRAATVRPFVIITVVQFTIANKTRGRRRSRADFFLEKRRKKSTTLGCSKRLTESNRFQLAHQQTHNRPRNEERIKAGTIDRDNIITHKNIDGDSLSLAKRFPLLVALSLSLSLPA
jgi:hypothetical protein